MEKNEEAAENLTKQKEEVEEAEGKVGKTLPFYDQAADFSPSSEIIEDDEEGEEIPEEQLDVFSELVKKFDLI